nr:hypothetical protein [Prevotella sp.]
MDKILYENTEYINKKRQAICKKVGAINEMLDGLLEQLGCVLSDKEIMAFMNNPNDLFEIVTHNLLCPQDVAVKLVVRTTISERLEPMMQEFKSQTRSLDCDNSYIIIVNGRTMLDVDDFEKAMDAHRLLLDSEPRQKAWKMAQNILLDINRLEKYLVKNQLGRVQPHAIGKNSIYCYDCLIQYNEKGRVELEPKAISCIK